MLAVFACPARARRSPLTAANMQQTPQIQLKTRLCDISELRNVTLCHVLKKMHVEMHVFSLCRVFVLLLAEVAPGKSFCSFFIMSYFKL